MPGRPAAGLVVALVGAVVLSCLTGCDALPVAEPAGATGAAPAPSGGLTAVAALAALATTDGNAPRLPDYDREAYGPAWTDTDRNGCDTRNDVLRRDLVGVTVKPGTQGCVAVAGTLLDPYTGATIDFVRGGSPSLQIDHVVSLSDAWRSGASAWPYAKRLALANDPLELLAVGSGVNQAKSDGTAAGWLPATAAGRCRLARTQVAVKQKYGLTVTPAERSALTGILRTCPDEPLPGSPVPTVAPNRSPAPG